MKYCTKCGHQLSDDSQYCNNCGASASDSSKFEENVNDIYNKFMSLGADETGNFNKEDIESSKYVCITAYLWFLFFIPLVACQSSKFARFHANQGLLLFAAEVLFGILRLVLGILFSWIPFFSLVLNLVFSLISLVFLVLIIYGIMNACRGEAKRLPIIGSINLIS